MIVCFFKKEYFSFCMTWEIAASHFSFIFNSVIRKLLHLRCNNFTTYSERWMNSQTRNEWNFYFFSCFDLSNCFFMTNVPWTTAAKKEMKKKQDFCTKYKLRLRVIFFSHLITLMNLLRKFFENFLRKFSLGN